MTPSTHTTDGERAGATVLSIWRGSLPRRRSMEEIATEIAERHFLPLRALLGRRTTRRVTWPRQEAYAVIQDELQLSSEVVGRFFGRDGSAIRHGVAAHHRRTAGRMAAE